jgi:hypothetical protein
VNVERVQEAADREDDEKEDELADDCEDFFHSDGSD